MAHALAALALILAMLIAPRHAGAQEPLKSIDPWWLIVDDGVVQTSSPDISGIRLLFTCTEDTLAFAVITASLRTAVEAAGLEADRALWHWNDGARVKLKISAAHKRLGILATGTPTSAFYRFTEPGGWSVADTLLSGLQPGGKLNVAFAELRSEVFDNTWVFHGSALSHHAVSTILEECGYGL